MKSTITGISFSLQSISQNYYEQLLGENKINTITTSVPFLMIAPDARSGAIGDAGAASSPDVYSQHWNPAKYAFMKKNMGIAISYSPWLSKLVDDINLAYLNYYMKLNDRSAFSASLIYFSLGEIQFTNALGQPLGSFAPNEFAIDMGYSSKLADNLSGGITFRYIYSNLTGNQIFNATESNAGQSVAGDVSLYYQKPFDLQGNDATFAFGANISNIGAKISYTETIQKDFIPTNLRLGFGFETEIDKYNTIGFMIDFNKLLVPTPPIYLKNDSTGQFERDATGEFIIEKGKNPNVGVVTGIFQSFSDAPYGLKEEIREISLGFGAEYWYQEQFAFRTGYFHEHATKGNRKYFTLGVGLKLNVFGIDIAYLIPVEQQNPLQNTLRFSLTFNFEQLSSALN